MTEQPQPGRDVTTRRRLGTMQLRAVAHPTRFRILEVLREGPANATAVASRIGESTGAASYHLRQLARYGLIEEDHAQNRRRERWWRRSEKMALFDVAETDAEHVAEYVGLQATKLERDDDAVQMLAADERLLRRRREAVRLGSWYVYATEEELVAITKMVAAAVDPLRRRIEAAPEGSFLTHITFRTIPLE